MITETNSGTPVPHQGGEASFSKMENEKWTVESNSPVIPAVETILLLGSGALKIGEAEKLSPL